jgi:hypothetical protein
MFNTIYILKLILYIQYSDMAQDRMILTKNNMDPENVVVLSSEASREFRKDISREKTLKEKEELKTAKKYYLQNRARRQSNKPQ